MREHWESQTRKMNKHYQSTNAGTVLYTGPAAFGQIPNAYSTAFVARQSEGAIKIEDIDGGGVFEVDEYLYGVHGTYDFTLSYPDNSTHAQHPPYTVNAKNANVRLPFPLRYYGTIAQIYRDGLTVSDVAAKTSEICEEVKTAAHAHGRKTTHKGSTLTNAATLTEYAGDAFTVPDFPTFTASETVATATGVVDDGDGIAIRAEGYAFKSELALLQVSGPANSDVNGYRDAIPARPSFAFMLATPQTKNGVAYRLRIGSIGAKRPWEIAQYDYNYIDIASINGEKLTRGVPVVFRIDPKQRVIPVDLAQAQVGTDYVGGFAFYGFLSPFCNIK